MPLPPQKVSLLKAMVSRMGTPALNLKRIVRRRNRGVKETGEGEESRINRGRERITKEMMEGNVGKIERGK